MKLVHLVTYNEKFIPSQLRFLKSQFSDRSQKFYFVGRGAGQDELLGADVSCLSGRTLVPFLLECHRADRIVFNGLFSQRILVVFLFFPWLIKKGVWLPWGGDLYWRKYAPVTALNGFIDRLRGIFIRHLHAIATPTRGDYLSAQEIYQTRAQHIDGCPNIFAFERGDLDWSKAQAGEQKKLKKIKIIQVGNSADPSNEHLEVFEWLRRYVNEDMEVHVPLSYGFVGQEEYREEVLRRGREIFGEKFRPLNSLLGPAEYNLYLATVDVMIFNHKRQQGFGNMVISLYLETKMYLRPGVSTWDYLTEKMGCTLFDTGAIPALTFTQFTELDQVVKKSNVHAVAHLFDRAWQKDMWGKLFSD